MNQRVWLITGASSGFGRAIAEAALAEGDTVVAAIRQPEAMADLVAAWPRRINSVELDVTDNDQIHAAVADTVRRHGRIDILVNNAGRGLVGAAEETTDEELRGLMDLHFFGPVALTRAVLPHMRANGTGAIVQMSSLSGRCSFPAVSGYSATKFALEGWSEALADEVAPFGIRVLIVEPGAFRTSLNKPGVLAFSAGNDAYRERLTSVRAALADEDGRQPGDPARAAAVIVSALGAPNPPLRLPLGNDAVDIIAAGLERARAELAAWESLSRRTDFPT